MTQPISAIKHVLSISKAMEQARTIKKLRAENSSLRNVLLAYEAFEAEQTDQSPDRDFDRLMATMLGKMKKLQAMRNKALGR